MTIDPPLLAPAEPTSSDRLTMDQDPTAVDVDASPSGKHSGWQLDRKTLREYWSWIGGSLYLLLSLDLLTTLYAASLHGVSAEANPMVRWAISQEAYVIVGLNLAALVVLVSLFAGYLTLLERTHGKTGWIMARSFELWIALLLSAGLFVFANNLAVIVLGESII